MAARRDCLTCAHEYAAKGTAAAIMCPLSRLTKCDIVAGDDTQVGLIVHQAPGWSDVVAGEDLWLFAAQLDDRASLGRPQPDPEVNTATQLFCSAWSVSFHLRHETAPISHKGDLCHSFVARGTREQPFGRLRTSVNIARIVEQVQ